jgi:omega-amidase
MKISIIQSDLLWEDKFHNLGYIGKMISALDKKTDIVILPEMFNTGFSMKTDQLGEQPAGDTFEWMSEIAEKGNFGLCGSYIVKENDQYFNRFVFVTPEKKSWFYNKRHLFSMGEEDKFYSPGKERLIFNFRGFRICPMICYDLRFPVWSRNRNEYDLLIYTANWPDSRRVVWNTLLKARALENQCFVAGANRIGTDGLGIRYSGESVILSPRGELIASADLNSEGVVTGEISLSELSEFRIKFPVLKDGDDFSINY